MSTDLALPESAQCLLDRNMWAMDLSIRSQSINADERSFEAVVATETPAAVLVRRGTYGYEVVDEILIASGGAFPRSMPLLWNHRRYSQSDHLGSARQFRLEGSEWVGRGHVGRAVEGNFDREQIWVDIADGHRDAVSIGYQALRFVEIPAGQSRTVDGRRFEAGEQTLRITQEWRAHELSLVPIGADEKALIRSRLGSDLPRPQSRSYFR